MNPKKPANALTASSDERNTFTSDPSMLEVLVDAGLASTTDLTARHAEAQGAWLDRVLGEMTEKQRFVVKRSWGLHDGTEYSFREIGECMGIHHKNVKVLYDKAMERLRGG